MIIGWVCIQLQMAQYDVFVQAGGYEEEAWWTKDGWKFAQDLEEKKPRVYREPFGLPNHPVVGVSWYEAQAFVTWLTDYSRKKGWLSVNEAYRLPNEPEWEKAARGTEGKIYPWGERGIAGPLQLS